MMVLLLLTRVLLLIATRPDGAVVVVASRGRGSLVDNNHSNSPNELVDVQSPPGNRDREIARLIRIFTCFVRKAVYYHTVHTGQVAGTVNQTHPFRPAIVRRIVVVMLGENLAMGVMHKKTIHASTWTHCAKIIRCRQGCWFLES